MDQANHCICKRLFEYGHTCNTYMYTFFFFLAADLLKETEKDDVTFFLGCVGCILHRAFAY